MSAKLRSQPMAATKRPTREVETLEGFRKPALKRSYNHSDSLERKTSRKRSLVSNNPSETNQHASKRSRKEKKKSKKNKKEKKKKKHHRKKGSKSGKREKCKDPEVGAADSRKMLESKGTVAENREPPAATPQLMPPQVPSPLPEAKTLTGKEESYAESDTDSELNLDRPLLRIQDYFDDKKEMCHQMFQTLQGRKLRSMIPEVLRGCSLIEVRDMCRKELEGMSRKRVLRILKGDDPKTISSSSSSGDNSSGVSSHSSKTSSSSSSRDSSPSASSSASNSSASSSSSASRRRSGRKRRHREKKSSEPVVDSTSKLELPPQEEKKEDATVTTEDSLVEQDLLVVSAADLHDDLEFAREPPVPETPATEPLAQELVTAPEPATTVAAPSVPPAALTLVSSSAQPLSRTQLEIAELEMRARAIRAMLKAQEKKDPRVLKFRK